MTEKPVMWDYPIAVIKAVLEYDDIEPKQENYDLVRVLKPTQVLRRYLNWEGILGYSDIILSIIFAESIA